MTDDSTSGPHGNPPAADLETVRKARVMIVDDSVVIRRILTEELSADPGIEVAATAANGRLGLAKLDTVKPDALVLDIEMPELDGLGTLREIRKRDKNIPIIMFSTLTARGAEATMEALALGASDYVTKPANMGSVAESRLQARTQLVPRLRALVRNPTGAVMDPKAVSAGPGATAGPANGHVATAPRQRTTTAVAPKILVIGCSTGGPEALAKVVAALPANLGVPVLVVQHMPPVFTTMYAERLDRLSPLKVCETADGVELRPGNLYLAPGDFHLEIVSMRGRMATKLTKGPPENFCRPAVDVLFRSAAAAYGPAVLATVLTGMGSDGKLGAEKIVAAGGQVIVQDQPTSVVWGMPGAVAEAGLAEAIIALPDMANQIQRRLQAGSPAGSARLAGSTDRSVPPAVSLSGRSTAAPPAVSSVPSSTAPSTAAIRARF